MKIRVNTDNIPVPFLFESGDVIITNITSLSVGYDVEFKKDGIEYIMYENEISKIKVGQVCEIITKYPGSSNGRIYNLDFFKDKI